MISTTPQTTSPSFDLSRATCATAPDAIRPDLDLARENLAGLCMHMEWLRSWWEQHGDMVRAADRTAAKQVHDHFIEGVCLSRRVARAAGIVLDVDYVKSFDWTTELPTLWQEMGYCTKGLQYIAGNLGLGDNVVMYVRDNEKGFNLSLEEVLHRIDEFGEPSQSHILRLLPFHFDVPQANANSCEAHSG